MQCANNLQILSADGEGHAVRDEAGFGRVPGRRAHLPREEWATVGLPQLLATHRTHHGSRTGGDRTARCQAYFSPNPVIKWAMNLGYLVPVHE